jgi:predicted DNA binding CopG/RHH family protein
MKTEPIQHNSVVTIRASSELLETIRRLALARGTKPSEWIRNALTMVADLETGAAR